MVKRSPNTLMTLDEVVKKHRKLRSIAVTDIIEGVSGSLLRTILYPDRHRYTCTRIPFFKPSHPFYRSAEASAEYPDIDDVQIAVRMVPAAQKADIPAEPPPSADEIDQMHKARADIRRLQSPMHRNAIKGDTAATASTALQIKRLRAIVTEIERRLG